MTNVLNAPAHAPERRDSIILDSSERRLDLSQRKESMYLPVIGRLLLQKKKKKKKEVLQKLKYIPFDTLTHTLTIVMLMLILI